MFDDYKIEVSELMNVDVRVERPCRVDYAIACVNFCAKLACIFQE